MVQFVEIFFWGILKASKQANLVSFIPVNGEDFE